MQIRLVHWVVLGSLLVTNSMTVSMLLRSTGIVELWDTRTEISAAYGHRISQLNSAVERLRSREILTAGSSATRIQEISDLQEQIGEQLRPVMAVAETIADLGIVSLDTQPAGRQRIINNVDELDVVDSELRIMERELIAAVAFLSDAVNRSTHTIIAELGGVGYAPGIVDLARGGPFFPAVERADAGFIDIGQTIEALDRFHDALRAMDDVPIHHPLETSRISSGFGTRQDPFTGRSAFHSGMDFPAPTGTPVRSAGRGIVTFVGWKGDYGRVVEIMHPSGLISRYPHLSQATVEEGDEVEAHMQIALVGSTGRSTGPHLHFEVRDQNGAIDPRPFLSAGERLRNFEI